MSINHAFDFFIQWHLTEKCNLRCKHCYQTDRNMDEMSFSEICSTIDEVSDTLNEWEKNYGVDFSPSFNITGGEPFLRKDLFEILSRLSSQGFGLYLLTNGILIDAKKAKKLFDLGVKGVQVSVEGTEEIHESIRGKGSYSASMKGVRHLLDAGLKVTLNATLSSFNADSFMDMIELSSNLGVHKLGFSRLVPSGRGELMLKEMLATGTVKALYEKIFSTDTGPLEIVTGDPVASQLRDQSDNSDLGDIPTGGCAAGISGLTILPDGTLVPCRRLHVPIGNIRKDSLREVWATSDVLNALRDRNSYKGKCGTCKRWAECRGCRAIAYAYPTANGEHDILADDPQCCIE
ncbi:MAG: radical SAM protein [Nitrospirae bacterium]|nr:radical SAM protein [Nitrospirota bacterium]